MDRLAQLATKWRIQAETLLEQADDLDSLFDDPDPERSALTRFLSQLDDAYATESRPGSDETHSTTVFEDAQFNISPTLGPEDPEDEWPRQEPTTHEPDRPNRGTFKVVGGTLMFYPDDVDALAQALEESDYTVSGIQGINPDVNVSAALKKLERARSSMEALEALVPGNYEMFNVAIGNLNRARQLLGADSGE